MPFDFDKFELALREKGVQDLACAACGAVDAWGYGQKLLGMQPLDDENRLATGGVRFVAAYCRNCGLTRLHAVDAVLGLDAMLNPWNEGDH